MLIERLLTEADHVLVAFDGPVAELPEDSTVAERLRVMVADGKLPRKVARATDPFAVLDYAAGIGPATGRAVYAQLCRLEREIVAGARLAAGVLDAMATMTDAGTRLTVISGLDAVAVRSFLVVHGLDKHVRHFVGRTGPDRGILPPAPDLLATVLRERAVESAVFVGSAHDDLAAGRAAGLDTYRYQPAVGKSWLESLRGLDRRV
jgi:phosphoglycolate phosphatase-like HAD superfamily hydrolase